MFFSTAIVTGCLRSQSEGVLSSQFIPPTLVATSFKTPTTDPFQPTIDPRDPAPRLTFIVTWPFRMGLFWTRAEIVKRWQVENSGTCEWTAKYSVRILSGASMGAEPKQKLEPIAPGETGSIEIVFYAPEETGEYYSQWQAYDDRGKPFGQDFFIDIIVSSQTGY